MKMKGIIMRFVLAASEKNVKGRQGAIVRIVGDDKKELKPDEFSWFCQNPAAGHSEMVLLNSSRVLEQMKTEMRKVYLYTRFAPCPDCAAQLATYPRTYPLTKFSLAYNDPLPFQTTSYGIPEVKAGIEKLVAAGWKVRWWTSGEAGREPQKWTTGKDKQEWTPQVRGDPTTAYETQEMHRLVEAFFQKVEP
jgi:hypothetical protein